MGKKASIVVEKRRVSMFTHNTLTTFNTEKDTKNAPISCQNHKAMKMEEHEMLVTFTITRNEK